MNSYNHQLPVGVIAQLVEHRTNITEVRVQVLFRPEFLGSYFAIAGSILTASIMPAFYKCLDG